MNIQSFIATRRTRIVAALTAGALFGSALPAYAAWQHAHGDSANTGFARLNTIPARIATNHLPLGPVAPGANPVVGPDGTVYVGNLAGEIKAFRANGTPTGRAKLTPSRMAAFSQRRWWEPMVRSMSSRAFTTGITATVC